MKNYFNLQYFGEGGEGAASDGASAEGMPVSEVGTPKGRKANPLANVKYGIQDAGQVDNEQIVEKNPETMTSTKSSEQRATDFENLIRGEYKAEFDSRVQSIINKRFGEAKKTDEQMKTLKPMLDMLSNKYGTDANDYESLAKAIQDDDAYYEDEALKKGLSVKQLKEMKQLERDNAQLREAQIQAQKMQQSQQIYSQWMQQTDEFNTKYGMNIDFATEAENPDFSSILKSGGSVEAAYKAVHFDDMVGGAMFKTAQTVTQKMANNLQAKANRPTENGISSRASAVTKTDVNSLTKADRKEILRRVERGERISF